MMTLVLFVGLMGGNPLDAIDRAEQLPVAHLIDRIRPRKPAAVRNLRGVVNP